MALEERILDILAVKDADAAQISEELDVEVETVIGVLKRLEKAGLLITK